MHFNIWLENWSVSQCSRHRLKNSEHTLIPNSYWYQENHLITKKGAGKHLILENVALGFQFEMNSLSLKHQNNLTFNLKKNLLERHLQIVNTSFCTFCKTFYFILTALFLQILSWWVIVCTEYHAHSLPGRKRDGAFFIHGCFVQVKQQDSCAVSVTGKKNWVQHSF